MFEYVTSIDDIIQHPRKGRKRTSSARDGFNKYGCTKCQKWPI